jgi:hypothetical protein
MTPDPLPSFRAAGAMHRHFRRTSVFARRRRDALPLPLYVRHCAPRAVRTALSAALPSLRAAGEAIYPSMRAPLNRFIPPAMTTGAERM